MAKILNQRQACTSGPTYAIRDSILLKLGFATYGDYLMSDFCKLGRKRAFERKGKNCTICGASATWVHHAYFDLPSLRGDRVSHLHPLCDDCRKKIDFDCNGKKRSPTKAHRAFCVARRLRNSERLAALAALAQPLNGRAANVERRRQTHPEGSKSITARGEPLSKPAAEAGPDTRETAEDRAGMDLAPRNERQRKYGCGPTVVGLGDSSRVTPHPETPQCKVSMPMDATVSASCESG